MKEKIPLPADKLNTLNICTVYLFGSCAEKTTGELSDIDIAVLLDDFAIDQGNLNSLYTQLYELFTDTIDLKYFSGIDIVFLHRVPVEMQYNIIRNGKVLYCRDQEKRLNFEDRVILKHADFKPILENFDREVLARL